MQPAEFNYKKSAAVYLIVAQAGCRYRLRFACAFNFGFSFVKTAVWYTFTQNPYVFYINPENGTVNNGVTVNSRLCSSVKSGR